MYGIGILQNDPELFELLVKHKITYNRIGEKINRDRTTVWRWLNNPNLDATRKTILNKAIEELKREVE